MKTIRQDKKIIKEETLGSKLKKIGATVLLAGVLLTSQTRCGGETKGGNEQNEWGDINTENVLYIGKDKRGLAFSWKAVCENKLKEEEKPKELYEVMISTTCQKGDKSCVVISFDEEGYMISERKVIDAPVFAYLYFKNANGTKEKLFKRGIVNSIDDTRHISGVIFINELSYVSNEQKKNYVSFNCYVKCVEPTYNENDQIGNVCNQLPDYENEFNGCKLYRCKDIGIKVVVMPKEDFERLDEIYRPRY